PRDWGSDVCYPIWAARGPGAAAGGRGAPASDRRGGGGGGRSGRAGARRGGRHIRVYGPPLPPTTPGYAPRLAPPPHPPPPPTARASMPPGWKPAPELIAPAPGGSIYENGAQFAWRAAPGAVKHFLLVSTEPFDPRTWTRLPEGGAVEVHEVARPVASLSEAG